MRVYQIPPDMSEKEKIIGGLLNINQFFWILTGLLLAAGFFATTFPILGGKFSLALSAIISLSGVPFVVYKKNGLTLFELIKYEREFKKKNHYLPNIRKEVDF